MVRLILFAAATLLLAGPVAAEEVRLVCLGTGTHAEETRAFSQTFDNTGFPNGLGDILGTRAVFAVAMPG